MRFYLHYQFAVTASIYSVDVVTKQKDPKLVIFVIFRFYWGMEVEVQENTEV